MAVLRKWGLACWTGLVVLLVALPMVVNSGLRTAVLEESAILFLISWSPMLISGIVAWGLVKTFGDRDGLDLRVTQALIGHPIPREVARTALFLLCFVLCMFVLSLIFGMYEAEIGADLKMSVALVSRLLFLFTLPVLALDRSGFTVDVRGLNMPALVMKVTEPWRWVGPLIPVLLVLGLTGTLLAPRLGLPPLSVELIGFLLAFVLIALCEEIFFRAMLQTRLEILMGRWGGIVSTSVLFALTYALIQPYDALAQLPGQDIVHDLGLALLTYAVAGLLYGYLWACFRNVWANVLIRAGLFLLIMPPDLQTGLP